MNRSCAGASANDLRAAPGHHLGQVQWSLQIIPAPAVVPPVAF
jgi:hypothetical protein